METILDELEARAGSGRALARYTKNEVPIVLRAIHTTADFDFAETMRFSPDRGAAKRRPRRDGYEHGARRHIQALGKALWQRARLQDGG